MTGHGNTVVGRPRGFDADEALQQAMLVFWKQGYEGASLSDLTSAMGITKTSMYAAFGNKEQLFRKALERYTDGPAAYGLRAMREPTAQAVATAFLNGTVRTTTRPECPAGCLGVQGALAAGDTGTPAHDVLVVEDGDAAPHRAVHRHAPGLELGAGAAVDQDHVARVEPPGEVVDHRAS